MNYYERHIGDYLKDTAHLSLLEHGIYSRLLDVYYTRENGIDAGAVARLLGARSKDELAATKTVLEEFFALVDGVWKQGRCDREIERYQDKQRKAKASADARWAHTERNANAMRTNTARTPEAVPMHSEGNALQTPDTSNQIEPIGSMASKPPRASRKCPASFEPRDPEAFIAENALGVDWRAETAKFRDHTFKTARSDWGGTWRNWMRSAAESVKPVQPMSFRERDAAVAAARVHKETQDTHTRVQSEGWFGSLARIKNHQRDRPGIRRPPCAGWSVEESNSRASPNAI